MKNYLVKVVANLPYPVEKEFRIEASHLATASQRAIKKWRKEVRGKRVKELSVKLIEL